MSWLFSQALAAEYLQGTCSDGEPFAPLSGNPMPQGYLPPDKMTEFSRLSRFGMIFKPLTEDHGKALLTWYLEGFRVKTSALPDEVQGLTEDAAECGEKWHGWLAKFDPDSCSWKTAQCSLFEEESESLRTLPRSGMTRSGMLWERQTLVHRISETESGWWLTPQANEDAAGTPNGKMQKMLGNDPKLRGTTPEEWARGTLNPTWTEWLMGWPLGWTDLKPLEMDKYLEWLWQHSDC
jgi:hypothetical protein